MKSWRKRLGKERRAPGANQHRLAVVAVCVEAPAVSIGGGSLILDIVPVGEVKRMSDGAGRRCAV
jgi:hypothetical protein